MDLPQSLRELNLVTIWKLKFKPTLWQMLRLKLWQMLRLELWQMLRLELWQMQRLKPNQGSKMLLKKRLQLPQLQKKKRELIMLKILKMITTTAMMIVVAMMTVVAAAVAMMLPSISHSLSILDQMEKLL